MQHFRVRVVGALAAVALTLVVAGCGSSTDDRPDVPTVTPASALDSPPARTPAGVVVPAPAGARAMALSGPTLALLSSDGRSVQRYATASLPNTPTGPRTTTGTPTPTAELTVLTGVGDGTFVGAGPDTLLRIDANGRTTATPTEVAAPTAVAVTADRRTVIGTDTGHVVVFGPDGARQRDIAGFVRVDDLTVSPSGADLAAEQVVVLDRAQSSVTPIDLDTGELGPALRAGNGATTSTVDRYGRVLVANTRDNEIIGFFGSPLVMRFRYPLPDGPYAVDYDDKRNLLWVSTTGNNEVVAYDLADGEPRETTRFSSVTQPDRIAVDDSTGVVYVLSARDGGLQVVAPAGQRPQGPQGG